MRKQGEVRMEHILRRGESPEMLSVRYGVPVCMIVKANGGTLQTGRNLMIPEKHDCCGERRYTVRRGDTLFGIAARYGTTMYDLCRKNPGVFSGKLTEGTELYLPAPMRIYTCGPLDTVKSVCEKFNITEDSLRRYNPLEKNLYQGLQLKIPESQL